MTSDSIGLTVGGYDVPRAEFHYALDVVRNDVVRSMASAGESVGAGFWSDSSPESPSAAATAAALTWIEQRYASYFVATNAGLVASPSWHLIQERFTTANEQRTAAIEAGEVVYGLPTYDLATFIQYEQSGFREAFAFNGSMPGMALSEEEIQKYFASHHWEIADGSIPALDDVRPNVVRQMRAERYEELLTRQVDLLVLEYDEQKLRDTAAHYLSR